MGAKSEDRRVIAANTTLVELEGRRSGRRVYRRILVGIVLLGCTLPVLGVIAPLHARWLASVGMSYAYSVVDDPEVQTWEMSSIPVMETTEIASLLASENGGTWHAVFDNPDLNRDLQNFAHADLRHPSVTAFRKATADLVPDKFDVFEVARRVRRLTNHQTDFDGDEIWDCLAAARGKRGLWCHHFCRVFGAVCTSRGYTTRLVSLSAKGDHFDHAVCEIFLPDMGGWIMIDVDFQVAYRSGSKWLTAVDLQHRWKSVRNAIQRKNESRDIAKQVDLEVVEFGQEESHLRAERFEVSPTGLNLELFEYVFLAVRDDYLSKNYPFGHPARIGQICFRADEADDLIEVCPEARYVAEQAAYAPVGCTLAQVSEVGSGPSLMLNFVSSMPPPVKFQVRQNLGNWQAVRNSQSSRWMLSYPINMIEARAVNAEGVAGQSTTLRVERR